MWENLFSTGANTGADSIFGNVASQGVNDALSQEAMNNIMFNTGNINAGLDAAVAQPGIGEALAGTADINPMANPSWFADKGNVNMLNLGLKGAGLINTSMQQNKANRLAGKNYEMSRQAFDRNVEADKARQQLNF